MSTSARKMLEELLAAHSSAKSAIVTVPTVMPRAGSITTSTTTTAAKGEIEQIKEDVEWFHSYIEENTDCDGDDENFVRMDRLQRFIESVLITAVPAPAIVEAKKVEEVVLE